MGVSGADVFPPLPACRVLVERVGGVRSDQAEGGETMTPWPKLSEPVFPMDNVRIAQVMSARGVDFDEAKRYAAEQAPSEPIPYEARRGE